MPQHPLALPFCARAVCGLRAMEVTAPRRYEMGGAGPAGPVESAARRARRARGGELSVATVYANVNENRPESYWNYDSLQVGAIPRRLFLCSRR